MRASLKGRGTVGAGKPTIIADRRNRLETVNGDEKTVQLSVEMTDK
jgi:hypothetical protein